MADQAMWAPKKVLPFLGCGMWDDKANNFSNQRVERHPDIRSQRPSTRQYEPSGSPDSEKAFGGLVRFRTDKNDGGHFQAPSSRKVFSLSFLLKELPSP
jgi:hypothetical protein